MVDYSGYGWIKVKKYEDDPSLTWEERYKRLESHHEKETTFLIEKVRELAKNEATEKAMEEGFNEAYEAITTLRDKLAEQKSLITERMIEDLEEALGMEVGKRRKCVGKGHGVIQQFTEICLECGNNSYQTDEQYYEYLQDLLARRIKYGG